MEVIITACVMVHWQIPIFCKRHWDWIFVARRIYKSGIQQHEQGFWTSAWRFVDRFEWMKIAKKASQLKKLDEDWKPIDYSGRDELYSEDLR